MELLLALALAWIAVAPDPVTLAVTRGAAGAVRGASQPSSDSGHASFSSSAGKKAQTGRMRAAVAGARSGVRASRVRRAEGRDLATRSVRVARASWRVGRSVASAARTRRAPGWAPGDVDREGAVGQVVVGQVVDDTTATDSEDDHDPEVDADTQDVEPTATQSRRWDKEPETEGDKRSFDLRAAGYDGWVDSQGYPADHAGWFPNDDLSNAKPSSTNDLEKDNMSNGNGMQVTELESLSEVRAEVEAATVMTEALTEAVQAAKDWASGLADRWSGTDWGTRQLDAGVVAVAESAATLVDGEAMAEALAVINAAVIEAQSLSEVLASAGAHGNVDRFHAA